VLTARGSLLRQAVSARLVRVSLESNSQFSQLQATFLVAYAIMYAGGGKLIDVMGTRKGYAAVMV